jgi:hypothetical protein
MATSVSPESGQDKRKLLDCVRAAIRLKVGDKTIHERQLPVALSGRWGAVSVARKRGVSRFHAAPLSLKSEIV